MNERSNTSPETPRAPHPWVRLLDGIVAGLMSDALANLEDEPSSRYDAGYHDALLDVLEAFNVTPDPAYGARFD